MLVLLIFGQIACGIDALIAHSFFESTNVSPTRRHARRMAPRSLPMRGPVGNGECSPHSQKGSKMQIHMRNVARPGLRSKLATVLIGVFCSTLASTATAQSEKMWITVGERAYAQL